MSKVVLDEDVHEILKRYSKKNHCRMNNVIKMLINFRLKTLTAKKVSEEKGEEKNVHQG